MLPKYMAGPHNGEERPHSGRAIISSNRAKAGLGHLYGGAGEAQQSVSGLSRVVRVPFRV